MIATLDLTQTFEDATKAARLLNVVNDDQLNQVLLDLADETIASIGYILEENKKDLARMDKSDPKYDRLLLNEKRMQDIAQDIRNVSRLASPLGKLIDTRQRPNGLEISRITVPLGVIGIIYEARPNVTFDVFSLCLKSGNICVLKGGSDAEFSNIAIVEIIKKVLRKNGLSEAFISLLPADRSATEALLNAVGYVDVIIPRGSQQLIHYVRNHSKVPVIETGAGIVHTYFDASADLEKGKQILHNSKTRRVSVCNALDCVLVHKSRLDDLPALLEPMIASNVLLYADEKAYEALRGNYSDSLLQKAHPEHFGTEFLDYKLAVKIVQDLNEALDHIAAYSSKHSEAILSENKENISIFLKRVDAAVVYANASTAYTDGAQFGLGAEIGISTQKLHARGPMALEELTSYKWIVKGDGQTRA